MNHFFAYMSRLKLINRWGLMRNTRQENDAEHSFQAAVIAHGIALIGKERFGREIDPEHVLALAVYHDAHEVITGDMPTPIKYHNPRIKQDFQNLEEVASDMLLNMLPENMQAAYQPYLKPDEEALEWRIVKAADRLCAYIKCLEEQKAGNQEFEQAKKAIAKSIETIDLPEVQAFFEEFVGSFGLTLDELNR
jgi:Predicted hydrolases of HD superfamily